MLPIVPDLDLAHDYFGAGRKHEVSWRLDLTPEGSDHPITRLASSPAHNRRVWERIPGFYWHLPVLRERPGARVLARHPDPTTATRDGARPLIVSHFFGPGRTLFVGIAETYTWRSVARTQYVRFWMQALRYLGTGKLEGGRDQLTLSPDVDRVPQGSVVDIHAEARGNDREPLELDSLVITATASDGKTRELTLARVPGRPGSYQGVLAPLAQGAVQLAASIPRLGSEPITATATVQFTPPERELQDSRVDSAALAALAKSTGGQALAPPMPCVSST